MDAFNIRRYGAVGDGVANDTAALQQAIDACHTAGGGLVLCPPGIYRVGSFELRSRVNLHVQAGATLFASADRRDYVKRLPFNAIVDNPYHGNFDEPLVYAADAEDVAITGGGTIDGNGRAFFMERPGEPAAWKGVRDWRPGMLLTFVQCRRLRLRDIRLVDSPCYAVFPLGCEDLVVDGITIRNDRRGPNTDGIDLHGCRDVRIANCSIDSGDDCITCYSMPYWLKHPGPCENVVVTNCILSSTCCGVRIGFAPSDHAVRNLAFSNLVMHRCKTGICLLCPLTTHVPIACETPARHGPSLENISFDHIIMDTEEALFLWTDSAVRAPAGIRNLNLSNITATTNRACYIGGSPEVPVEGVRIRNMKLTMTGEVDGSIALDPPDPVSCWGCPQIPHAFYIRHARGVALADVEVDWGAARGPWRSAVRATDVRGLDFSNLVAAGHGAGTHPAVHLGSASDVFLRGCRLPPGTRGVLES